LAAGEACHRQRGSDAAARRIFFRPNKSARHQLRSFPPVVSLTSFAGGYGPVSHFGMS
jgi:hypothetical protein